SGATCSTKFLGCNSHPSRSSASRGTFSTSSYRTGSACATIFLRGNSSRPSRNLIMRCSGPFFLLALLCRRALGGAVGVFDADDAAAEPGARVAGGLAAVVRLGVDDHRPPQD